MSTDSSPLSAPSTSTTGSAGAPSARPDDDRTAVQRPADAPLAGRREAARRKASDGDRERGTRSSDRDPTAPGRRRPPSRRTRKVRRVHRVVRHVEVWSIAKLATIYVACGYVVAMVSGYLLWRAADRVGTIEGIEGFMEDSGAYADFQILGTVVFKAASLIGVILAVLTIFVVVLAAVLFNLISDLTGGIRMTVIDEDLVVAPARRPSAPAPGTRTAAAGPPTSAGSESAGARHP